MREKHQSQVMATRGASRLRELINNNAFLGRWRIEPVRDNVFCPSYVSSSGSENLSRLVIILLNMLPESDFWKTSFPSRAVPVKNDTETGIGSLESIKTDDPSGSMY